jgi:hypothetical protein
LGGIVDPATAKVKLMSAKDTQSDFDQAKAEAFAGKLLTALNNGGDMATWRSLFGWLSMLHGSWRERPASSHAEQAADPGDRDHPTHRPRAKACRRRMRQPTPSQWCRCHNEWRDQRRHGARGVGEAS